MANKIIGCDYNVILHSRRIGNIGKNWAELLIEFPEAGRVPMVNVF